MAGKYCAECGQELPQIKPTHIVAILDMSGSMMGTAAEVINSFKSFVDEQKKIEGKASVSLILFDTAFEMPYVRRPLHNVPKLTNKVYAPRGCTALFDAINLGITEYFDKDRNEKTIFVIITDGAENASRIVRSHADIKRKISTVREHGAEFVFMAADEASFAQGAAIGIPSGNTFCYDSVGYSGGIKTLSSSMGTYRTSSAASTNCFFVDTNANKNINVLDDSVVLTTTSGKDSINASVDQW